MNQNTIKSICLFAIACLTTFSCQKDEIVNNSNLNPNLSYLERGRDCWEDVQKECGLLKFDDMDHFTVVYECLKNEVNSHIFLFDSIHSGLSDDDFNALIDSIGWSEDEPLEDFEAHAMHYSYRKDLVSAENTWLAGGMIGDNPWYVAGMGDVILTTLLSNSRAFFIGNDLYYFNETGQLYVATNGSCEDLAALIEDADKAVENNTNIQLWISTTISDCLSDNGIHGRHNWASNRDLTWLHSFHVWPWGTVILSNICSYKQNIWGNWKRWRSNLAIHQLGILYTYTCEFDQAYNEQVSHRAKYLELPLNYWGVTKNYKTLEPECRFYINGQFVTPEVVNYLQ